VSSADAKVEIETSIQVSEIRVPDLEGSKDVAVVEVYISPGDRVDKESPVISLESDKAVMDVPSPVAGVITEVVISAGAVVNAGDLIALIKTDLDESAESSPGKLPVSGAGIPDVPAAARAAATTPESDVPASEAPVNRQKSGAVFHATPSVRALARELGIDLVNIPGTGPKGRITREDVTGLVKKVMFGSSALAGGAGALFSLPPIPSADYGIFGEIETVALSRIKKVSGPHLHRNWIGVPHVTQFEDADITELEEFRKELNAENQRSGKTKISPLIFIIKAAAQALREFPDFNSSLGSDGATLIRKKYINIGIAVDTPGGLVVPVIRNPDCRGVQELADILGDLSGRAREGKLKSDELKGGTFSISSLGGIGGTWFTPIVNAPEVAILGLSRSAMKPVWNGKGFEPRLILPFALSYDHRVIDGAQGAHFAVHLSKIIGDVRRALL
jgi:pyruvate dehydrogenase E2 component (dihydrolipoamide acetyltransferase)